MFTVILMTEKRFAFFQLAAIEAMERIDFIPDLLHVHDYHTAMIPFLLKEKYRWIQAYEGIKTVLTIHNLEFQGQFSEGMLWDLFGVGFERYADGTLRWNNCLKLDERLEFFTQTVCQPVCLAMLMKL